MNKRSQSLSNNHLFKAFVKAFEAHNKYLLSSQVRNIQPIKDKEEVKLKAQQLRRVALKQVLLDTV